MNEVNSIALDRAKATSLAQLLAFTGIIIIAPFFHMQMLTGPVINAVLFIVTALLGVRAGIFAGLVPSVIALSIGTLPAPLAPMIPYIMLGNMILVFTFHFLKERNYWLGVVTASFLKFLFLFASSSVVVGLLAKSELAVKVAYMMSWPQLLTALAGGVIARVFLNFYQGRK
ncbi:MAG: hypothetical protein ABFQ53_01095 [Patescibacteria group bacterium]